MLLTRVVSDQIQEGRKTVVCLNVCVVLLEVGRAWLAMPPGYGW